MRGEVVGVELDAVHAHRAGPDQPARFVEAGDGRVANTTVAPLTNRRATASPISLRPPSTMVFATAEVSRTADARCRRGGPCLPRRAAVLGSPISHSLSPVLHGAAYAALGLDGVAVRRVRVRRRRGCPGSSPGSGRSGRGCR